MFFQRYFTLLLATLFLCGAEEMDAQVSAGQLHSLFLCSSGEVMASGNNQWGQLGDGTNTNRVSPVKVNGLSGIIAVAAANDIGIHSLFLDTNGTAWGCGYNRKGQLGDGTTTDKNSPVQVSGLTSIMAVDAGGDHSLFLIHDSTVWACGLNSNGQLGDGTTTNRTFPVQIGLTGISAISAGERHSLFLKNDGTVWACGFNSDGRLGDGTNTTRTSPGSGDRTYRHYSCSSRRESFSLFEK